MMHRDKLRSAVIDAFSSISAQGEGVPAAIDGPQWEVESPAFGRCRLVPHSVDTPPLSDVSICYVALEGYDTLTASIWSEGRFNTRGMKPLKRNVVRWYHMERLADGKTF